MKNHLLHIVLFLTTISITTAQNTDDIIIDKANYRCLYHLSWLPNPKQPERRWDEKVLLLIGDSISRSMALNTHLGDSVIRNTEPEILFADLRLIPQTLQRFRIFKNYPQGKITTVDYIYTDRYVYNEPFQPMNWTLHQDTAMIAGRVCQKATTTLGSREWIAWFTPEISIPEGPYKFHGLPGLIVKIEDSEKHYMFTLEYFAPANQPDPIFYPSLTLQPVSKSDFLRMQNRFTQNPSSYIVEEHHGLLSDDPATQRQIIRSLSRQNNYIELFEP